MAILKSKEMKDINKDIVEAGGIALTELEFRDSTSLAAKVLKLKEETYHYKDDENPLDYFDYIAILANNSSGKDIGHLEFVTAHCFGLDRYSTIVKIIAHPTYELVNTSSTVCETCSTQISSPNKIETKIEAWVNYSKILKKYRDHTYEKFPNWDELAIKNKNVFIKSLKEVEAIPFVTNTSGTLVGYIHFLENYHKSKKLSAKITDASASLLLSLNLPNINTKDIARQITEQSSLNK